MVALLPHDCSCGEHALVLLGESTPGSLMTALEVSERLGATLVLAPDDEPKCPACGAAYETSEDPVVRVFERLAAADAGIPALNF